MTLMGLAELDYLDVSLVVSDNSDAGVLDENSRMIEETLKGRRHIHVRPGRVLPMADHWNFALDATPDADFFGIVTDRMMLMPAALSICDEVLSKSDQEAVCFKNGVVCSKTGTALPDMPSGISARVVESDAVLDDFAKTILRKDSPRFLNSFVSRSCISRIKQRYGTVFAGISPDYAFAFRFLDTTDRYASIDAPILIDHSPSVSNGMAMTRNIGNAAAKDFLHRAASEQSSELAFGPIPFETTLLPNVILRELEIAKSRANEATRLPVIDTGAFHVACAKAMRRSVRFFDPHSQRLAALIEEYRVAHGLPHLSARVRRTTFLRAVKNTVSRWVKMLLGTSSDLAGVLRDEKGDLELLTNLRNIGHTHAVSVPDRRLRDGETQ